MKHSRSVILLCLIAYGCTMRPATNEPTLALPKELINNDILEKYAHEQEENFFDQFNDEELVKVVNAALQKNYDVRIAEEKINELRALYKMEDSALWPQIDNQNFAQRYARSENVLGNPLFGPKAQWLFQVGLNASWEIDFFGAIRSQKAAAYQAVLSQEALAKNTQIIVAAEGARLYIEAKVAKLSIQNLGEQLRLIGKKLDLSKDRFQAGLDSAIDEQTLIQSYEEKEIQLSQRIVQYKRNVYELALLLGITPQDFKQTYVLKDCLPEVEGKIPSFLPSQLLERRPDVYAAFCQLHQQESLTSAAKAELLPSFTLTGGYGRQSNIATTLFKTGSDYWNLTPTINWPIFHGGQIRANIRMQTSKQKQAFESYEKTLLSALADIEKSLVSYLESNNQLLASRKQMQSSGLIKELRADSFQAGLIDEASAIDASLDFLDVNLKNLESQGEMMASLILLYKALGGGWKCGS